MTDVTITFPDGKTKPIPAGTTGLDVAKGISPSLAKRTVAMQLDGVLSDLNDPISKDAKINFVARTDAAAHAPDCSFRQLTVAWVPAFRYASAGMTALIWTL